MKNVMIFLIIMVLLLVALLPFTTAFATDDTANVVDSGLPAWAWTLITVAIIVVVILLIYFILPRVLALAQKKGWDVKGFLTKAGLTLEKADVAVGSLIKLGLPINIVDMVIDYAKTGVGYAEQLLYSSQITDEKERGVKAREAILTMLRMAGMSEEKINSPDVQKLINIGVEYAVGKLGHTDASIQQIKVEGM